MNKIISFGENVKGYSIPVLNEREIRASAGILFIMMFFSILTVGFTGKFLFIKYSVSIFLLDILIRVFINPKFSPLIIIGRLIVRNQTPEYVGAEPKKFAWIIGAVLGSIMFLLLVIGNSHSEITAAICLLCLVFLFFETAFGICLGCIFYAIFFKEKAKYCSGNICEESIKHDIQKTSKTQFIIVIAFVSFILLSVLLFDNYFRKKPLDLFGNVDHSKPELVFD